MKTLTKLIVVSIMILSCCQTASAQSTRKEKQATKAAEVKKMVDDVNYVFEATYVYPMRGSGRQLTSDYDFKVLKDTISAWLPYFGRAYLAPNDPTKGGIQFKSTNFNYSAKAGKKGGWEIVIKPKDTNMLEMTDVQQVRLNISSNGYASLQVISTNRDPISFDGYIQEAKTKM
jgi:Domain of unknown function (DUF4251)